MPRFSSDFIQRRFEKRDLAGLAKLLHHRDEWVRSEAAEALAQLRDPRAVGPLMAAYTDPRAGRGHMPERIIRALELIGDEAAADFLAKIYLVAPGSDRGRTALRALNAIGGQRAEEISRLAQALENATSGDPERHALGVDELRALGPVGINALVTELRAWESVRARGSHPDLGMADAIEQARGVAAVLQSIHRALEAVAGPGWRDKLLGDG